jgi:NADPH:quinone reductase-like Zn-dependent oxidoreductase
MPRTVRFHAFGEAEELKIEELTPPSPSSGEVRLRIRAIGINRAEILFRAGQYVGDPTFPSQLGYEAAGEIEALGADVSGWAIGDRVSVIPAFLIDGYGLYGEVSLAPARALVAVPKDMPWTEAAANWMQYGTAWGGLIGIANLRAGQTVLIPAASSSVGLAAIQIARMVGATPIALTRTSDKRAVLLEAGAAAVIATEEQDLVAEVMRLTEGNGAQLAFDSVGGPTFSKLAAALAPGGMAVIYGALSPEPTALPLLELMLRDITIRAYAFAMAMHDDQQLAAMKAFVNDGIASGALRPKIARTFPFDEIVEAHRFVETNTHIGKVIVTV